MKNKTFRGQVEISVHIRDYRLNPKLWCIRKNARRALLCRNPGLTKLAGVCISPQTISVEDTSQSIYKFERQGKGLRPFVRDFGHFPTQLRKGEVS